MELFIIGIWHIASASKLLINSMEFSTRHVVHFTPAVQVGWNQIKPVRASSGHMASRQYQG